MLKKIFITVCIVFISLSINTSFAKENCKSKKISSSAESAKKYEGYAKHYDSKATKAKENGNNALAKAYQECAAAKRIISKAYATGDAELMKKGRNAYSAAKKNLKLKCSKK